MGIKIQFFRKYGIVAVFLAATCTTLWAQTRVPLIYPPQKEQKSRNTQVLQNPQGAEALEVFTSDTIPTNRWLLRKKINDVPSWWGIFSGKLRHPLPANLHAFEIDSARSMHFFREARLFPDSLDAQKQHLPKEVSELYFNGQILLVQEHQKLYYQKNGLLKSIVAMKQLPPMLLWLTPPVAGSIEENGESIAQTGDVALIEEGYHFFTIHPEEHYSLQRMRYFHPGQVFTEILELEPMPKWQNGAPVLENIVQPEPGFDLTWVEHEMIQLQNTLQNPSANPDSAQKLIKQLQQLHQTMSTDTLRALFNVNDLYFEPWDAESRSLPFLLNVGQQHFDFQLQGHILVPQADARELLWYLDHQKQRSHPVESRRQRFRKVPMPSDYARQNAWVEISYINRQARARRHDRDQLMFFDLTGARLLLPGRSYPLQGTWKFPSFVKQTKEWKANSGPFHHSRP